MARRIQESDFAVLHLHLICANVLCDSAGLLLGHARFANRIKQRCFSMIDVTHDGHHRSARNSILGDANLYRIQHHRFFERDELRFRIEILRNAFCHFLVERLIDRGEYAPIHQSFLHVFREDPELFGKILYGDTFGKRDLPEFARGFRLRLRSNKRRFELLLCLTLVALCAIHPLVDGRTSLFHRRCRPGRSSRPNPGTLSRGRSGHRATVLQSRRGRVPLSRTLARDPHRSLSIRSPLLAWRRSGR